MGLFAGLKTHRSSARRRRGLLILALSFSIVCALSWYLSRWFTQNHRQPLGSMAIGRPVPDFRLRDVTGRKNSLSDFKNQRAIVLFFEGIDCPVGNLYMPRLVELSRKYEPLGVAFVGINSNAHEAHEDVAAHARSFGAKFPVLMDPTGRVANLLNVDRTCEVLLIDGERRLRYRGAIDDQYLVGSRKANPDRQHLVEALDSVLTGRPVTLTTTEVAGCPIEFATARPASNNLARVGTASAEIVAARRLEVERETITVPAVTYASDVAPILREKCQSCHRAGQVGPFELIDYDDAKRWSASIREVVEEFRMPPWHADPRHGQFANDRSLTARQRATLIGWVDQGSPAGDLTLIPTPRADHGGWSIGRPDVVYTMPVEFQVPAEGTVDYQHFRVKTGFDGDRWIRAAEVRPGDRAVVHHVGVYIDLFGPNRGGSARGERPLLAFYFPGEQPSIFGEGIAKRIPKGADLYFEVHYTPTGRASVDRSSIGLIFADGPITHEAVTRGISNKELEIPPGIGSHAVRSSYTFPTDVHLLSLMPHMHLRGRDFVYRAVYPDGRSEVLLSVPSYDFAWQSAYQLIAPKALPRGTRIDCLAHFDNSEYNPANPDPNQTVTWGEQSWEEMMIGYIDYFEDDARSAIIAPGSNGSPRR